MSHRVAGIDVHEKVLMVVVIDSQDADWGVKRKRFGTASSELRLLSEWLREQGVEEAVMESAAQYWKPVWYELESSVRLHLAQAFSNRAPKGRKHDFRDAERLVRRLLADEVALRSGLVMVGSLPTIGGSSATAAAGCLIVLNSKGDVIETFWGHNINGPWDMTAVDGGNLVGLFVTNVLNGTVAAGGSLVNGGTVFVCCWPYPNPINGKQIAVKLVDDNGGPPPGTERSWV